MKERIKGAFTKKKILHFLKMALFVMALSLILLSLLGTVAHATGLVDDTINAENLYSKYPLSNYQLDFYEMCIRDRFGTIYFPTAPRLQIDNRRKT